MSKIDIFEIGYVTPKILLYILTFHKHFLFQLIFDEGTPGTVLRDFFKAASSRHHISDILRNFLIKKIIKFLKNVYFQLKKTTIQ